MQSLFVVNDERTSAYCPDVEKLMDAMNIINYKAEDWRLFIDSSKCSLKAILLHKTNEKPSIPIAYSTETYEALENILKMVEYSKHRWRICCDLKVVAILSGLQSGYVKHMCFICDWDSRYSGNQYACHDWKQREDSKFAMANIIRKPLVPKDNILLPPLHIKLGLVKNFIKTIAKRNDVLLCLKEIYPRLSESKIKEGESRNTSLQSDDIAVHSRSVAGVPSTETQLESETNRSVKEESSKETHRERRNSAESSTSPERSQRNETFKSISGSRVSDEENVLLHRSLPPSSAQRRRTPEKIPYFIDEVRERDRIRRKYGIVSDIPSSLTASARSRRSRSTARSRHSSPNRDRTHRRRSTSRDRYASAVSRRYRGRSRSDNNRDRNAKYRHRSEDRDRNRYRRRSFHSSSRSRTPSHERITRSRTTDDSRNERRRYRHGDHDEASNADLIQRNLPQTQIITIPVPVPTDFLNYSYPAWPTPTQWNPHLVHPPRYGARAAYPILPATVIAPIRPPFPLYGLPHPAMHYGGRGLRFRPNYGGAHPWHHNFRGRNS